MALAPLFLTADEVAVYAKGAGFTGTNLVKAVAIAYAESRFNEHADNSGTYLGLWQISTIHVPAGTSPSVLYAPNINAEYAFKLSGGSNFQPWQTYTQGTYLDYMALATDAVQRSLAPTYPAITFEINGVKVPAIGVHQGNTEVTYVSVEALHTLGIPFTVQSANIYVLGGSRYISGIVYNGQVWIPWNEIPGISKPTRLPGGGWSTTDKLAAVAAVAFASYGLLRITAG